MKKYILLLSCFVAAAVGAKVRLLRSFSDGIVLQLDVAAPVCGWETTGEIRSLSSLKSIALAVPDGKYCGSTSSFMFEVK